MLELKQRFQKIIRTSQAGNIPPTHQKEHPQTSTGFTCQSCFDHHKRYDRALESTESIAPL
jgi:hypothetical protein